MGLGLKYLPPSFIDKPSLLKELQLSISKFNHTLKLQLFLTRTENFTSKIPRILNQHFEPDP
jgi:hypothetical protein